MAADDSCANPLLLEWTSEWLAEARERGSKGVTTYKKAYDSLKACPIAFSHPSEAQQLHGLGPKLCERLTKKLEAHCSENGLPLPEAPQKVVDAGGKRNSDEAESSQPKRTRKTKPYVPAVGSGPFAILIALTTVSEHSSQELTKFEIIERAQPFCDSSFSAPSEPGKFYTAWNSMRMLMSRELVYERGRPLRKYALTEEGWDTAKKLKSVQGQLRSNAQSNPLEESERDDAAAVYAGEPLASTQSLHSNDRQSRHSVENTGKVDPQNLGQSRSKALEATDDEFFTLSSSPPMSPDPLKFLNGSRRKGSQESDLRIDKVASGSISTLNDTGIPQFTPITIPAGSFTVELVLDSREVRSRQDRQYIQEELSRRGVVPVMRSLECGDALWTARCREREHLERFGEEGEEIVLDYIVERKRLDDLVGSIKDGRFHEQKFRLRKSGVKNVIYIIEEVSISSEMSSRYLEAVESAIASTQVVNGYFVKRTQKLDDTIRYLAHMTETLRRQYQDTDLRVIPSRVLTPLNHLPLLASLQDPLYVTFATFSSLASKSDALTLRDIFLKMLMCTRGVTGDKALAIQKTWKTPHDIMEAFDHADANSKGDLVFSKHGNAVGRKKIGKALSAKFAEVWS